MSNYRSVMMKVRILTISSTGYSEDFSTAFMLVSHENNGKIHMRGVVAKDAAYSSGLIICVSGIDGEVTTESTLVLLENFWYCTVLLSF